MINQEDINSIEQIKKQLLGVFNEIPKYQDILNLAFEFTEKGSHKNNHYHNPKHCYVVAKLCKKYMDHQSSLTLLYEQKLAIFLAALFHDYKHSGKSLAKVVDRENINKAIIGILTFQLKLMKAKLADGLDDMFDLAVKAIRSTTVRLVNGKVVFSPNPKDFIIFLIRDADVTMALDSVGKTLMPGLAKEIGISYDLEFECSNIEFQKNVKLYTTAAIYYRERYLSQLEEKHDLSNI
jgi:hypothetical protein